MPSPDDKWLKLESLQIEASQFLIIGRVSFILNSSKISIEEAYKILNLDIKKNISKKDVQKAYIKIQKKIHPDISPETARLSTIVNEAKDLILKNLD